MKIKIRDLIYILDIQNKNRNIEAVLVKYGLEHPRDIKRALKAGRWAVATT